MYKSIIRPYLFRRDAESAHHLTFKWMQRLFAVPGAGFIAQLMYRKRHASLAKTVFGIRFENPVGLAAGFDKNAILTQHWKHFGFGFIEIGTVTPYPQEGNPLPRLFRLPLDRAIINRMGFNNAGLDAVVRRLQAAKNRGLVVGGNIGKNKSTPNSHALEDYRRCFEALHPHVDYFVVNVSSPNTPGLRELQEKGPLTELLGSLQQLNRALATPRPILLKIAPDLTDTQLDDILEIVQMTGIAGLVATNTTISREGLKTPDAAVEALGAGGLSGAPLRARSLEVLRYIRAKAGNTLPIISVGGIMDAADAKARIAAGADLVQVYTGFVYAGPSLPSQICKALMQP